MPARVITMTRDVIKDIKSGRRGAKESGKKKEEARKGETEKKKDGENKGWDTLGGRGRQINRLLYAA